MQEDNNMNRTEIKLNGENISILFGCWAVGQILRTGVDLSDLKGGDLYLMLPEIAYYGACNAKGRDLNAYNLEDFHNLSAFEVAKVLPVFTASMSQDVPKKNEVTKEAKKQPK